MPGKNAPILSVGQSGQLSGKHYRIAGRIEMSMEEDGETYRWTEYYLAAPDGSTATLVQEDGERGVEWRMFRLIEPTTPMSAEEAATRRVGDTVDLTGQQLRVTCVDESRVVRVEGQAPEGVEEGDVARYFNAESGNQMVVVSWTGDEVEVFRGIQLPNHAVNRAFGLKATPVQLHPAGTRPPSGSGTARKVLVGIVLALLGIGVVNGRRFGCNRSPASAPPPKPPPAKLAPGQTRSAGGTPHRVTGRTLVEIARVGARHARQEYQLMGADGASVVLVQGTARSVDEWLWLRPLETALPWRPSQAATNRLGDTVSIAGEPLRVTDLFLTRVLSAEGPTNAASGTLWYGFEARGGDQRVIVRWDEKTLFAHRVSPATRADLESLGVQSLGVR